MRFYFLPLLLTAAFGQHLQVPAASARATRLAWDGTGSGWVVERKDEGGAWHRIGESAQPSYEDTTIDAYTTYRYHVLAGADGKPSNEVVVGPPPSGVQNIARVPAGDPVHYAANTAIALDENGDPAVAFQWVDPNGDTDLADSEVEFVRWNRAAHTWTKPARILVVGEIPSQNTEPVSIACDQQSGALAVVTPVHDQGLAVLISTDHGATWRRSGVAVTGAGSTSVAFRAGILHIAASSSDSGVSYITGPPSQLQIQALKPTAGFRQAPGTNTALALDADGRPVVAWFESREEGDGARYVVWRPATGATPVLDLPQSTTDSPALALASAGDRLALLVQMPKQSSDDLGVQVLTKSGAGNWSARVTLPADGPRTTNPPLAVALDSRGGAIAAFGENSGSAGPTCDGPAVARWTNGARWNTCGVGRLAGASFSVQPNTIRVIFAGNDKAYVLWQEPAEQKYGQGLLLYHER